MRMIYIAQQLSYDVDLFPTIEFLPLCLYILGRTACTHLCSACITKECV